MQKLCPELHNTISLSKMLIKRMCLLHYYYYYYYSHLARNVNYCNEYVCLLLVELEPIQVLDLIGVRSG